MRYAVVQTHLRGVKRSTPDIRADAPAVGNLVIGDWGREYERRHVVLHARLMHPGPSIHADLLLPIFDVRIIKMNDAGFYLRGYQIEVVKGEARHLLQGWWVRPA